MDPRIDAALCFCNDGLSRDILLSRGIPRAVIDTEVRRGGIVRVFPSGYVRASAVNDPAVRERAAYHSVGHRGAISHLSALRRHGLLATPPLDVHVALPAHVALRRRPGLVIHREAPFPRCVRDVDRIIVTSVAEAIAQSWPLLPRGDRRAPAITAVRERIVTAEQLRGALNRRARVPDRNELLRLIDLLALGCESELEIWGALRVFDVPGLRHGTRQLWVTTDRGRRLRLDLAFEAELLNVEMDGGRYHSTSSQRARDFERDAALAALGWLTLRFPYARLIDHPDDCRRETLAVLAARRRLLPNVSSAAESRRFVPQTTHSGV